MADTERQVQKRLKALRRGLARPKTVRPSPMAPRPWKTRLRNFVVLGVLAVTLWSLVFPPLFWPVRGPVSSGFFVRLKPDQKAWSLEIHHGIDVAAPRGTPVSATALGLVAATGRTPELGNYVRVSHLWGLESLYAHLDKIEIGAGQLVVPGWQVLGRVGATGRATGPHLHLGVFFFGFALPPDVLLTFHSLRIGILGG